MAENQSKPESGSRRHATRQDVPETGPEEVGGKAAPPDGGRPAADPPAPARAAEDEPAGAESAGRIAELEAEVAELKNQLLRALAEVENTRRRTQRDRDEAVRYAAAPLIKDLMGVADNLRRALESVPAEAVEGDEALKALCDGVEMTERELLSIFEKHGIVRIDPAGEILDPHHHEAVFEIPEPNAPAGMVLQVLRPGYKLHDRLLRPAQVGVAKGGPKPENVGGERSERDGQQPGSRVDTSA